MFKKSVSLLPNAALVAILGSVPSFADIKIGVLVPDSGPAGLFGPSTRNSATLAAQDINAAGASMESKLNWFLLMSACPQLKPLRRLCGFGKVRGYRPLLECMTQLCEKL